MNHVHKTPLSAFPERAERLGRIAADLPLSQDHPLLKAASLPEWSAEALKGALIRYLHTTLTANYPDRDIPLTQTILEDHADLITALPNVTPNGIVLPKLETYVSHMLLHRQVVEIFEASGFPQHVEAIQAPINVRLVSGKPDAAIDGRPRASAKFHTDIWAGEPASGFMVFLPVLGDTENIGIKWVEPASIPQEFRQSIADFEQGRHLIDDGTTYRSEFRNGDIILSDPLLIHATQKNGGNLRISLDIRCITREKIADDATTPGERRDYYYPYEVWRDIGRGHVLTTAARLEPFTGPDNATSNSYAARYEIFNISDRKRPIDPAAIGGLETADGC